MIDFIKKNLLIIIIFLTTLTLGFLTCLTFIDRSFIDLNEYNLQVLLISNIILIIFFIIIIIYQVKQYFRDNTDVNDIKTNKKYIAFFSLFTLIPSILISVFSLFLFSFALDQYLDKRITTAVNNSYELAKNYVDQVKNKIESDVILIGYDLNKNVSTFYENPKKFKNILKAQRLVRGVDEIHLINSSGNLIASTLEDYSTFISPDEKSLNMVFAEERPLQMINAFDNKSSIIIKLSEYIDTYLYVVKFLDPKISRYLTDSQEAINFYYTVESKSTGIRISFILIYLVVVTLLLFLSISIAIKFSSKFFRAINNLIFASSKIGKGNLDVKVPLIKSDKELEILNNTFNNMIDQLKSQQEKLLINERHEAWDNVAKKLAHEIKNPLTPIQLTIDRLKNKYLDLIDDKNKSNFEDYLKTINKQIKLIEGLVNEFSDFARMPKPIFNYNDLLSILNDNVRLLKELDNNVLININSNKKFISFYCDGEQISRVFFNLIKNSIESIDQKYNENGNFAKKIDIEIITKKDYIEFIIVDNGIGFGFFKNKIKDFLSPYLTKKKKGSGLGLSIVNKIVNDHNGKIKFIDREYGAKIVIKFLKNDN